jgi:transposase
LCDLRKHKILDVVKGRSENDLKAYLLQLTGKEQVKIVCMDLSRSYRQLVRKYFPNAKIVSDRFHVIRLLNHQAMQTYHQIDPELKYQRGLLGILRRRDDRLSIKQKQQRELYFNRYPLIKAVYDMKHRLYELLITYFFSIMKYFKFTTYIIFGFLVHSLDLLLTVDSIIKLSTKVLTFISYT